MINTGKEEKYCKKLISHTKQKYPIVPIIQVKKIKNQKYKKGRFKYWYKPSWKINENHLLI